MRRYLFGFSLSFALSATDNVAVQSCFHAELLVVVGSALAYKDIFELFGIRLLYDLLKSGLIVDKNSGFGDEFYLIRYEREQKSADFVKVFSAVKVNRGKKSFKRVRCDGGSFSAVVISSPWPRYM